MCPFELSSELSTGSSAQVLCVDLDGWMGGGEGGGPKGEGIYVCLELIHSIVQQKLLLCPG